MWRRLSKTDALAVGWVLVLVAAVTVPKLPVGVCFSDSGDLQLGATTLGIMHPTGYGGYTLVGYLLTRIPWVDHAYVVTLACLLSGLIALGLCMLAQLRLGVDRWVVGAVTLALVAHGRVWQNLVAPEVYMPTLALVAGSAYLLWRYVKIGARRYLLIAVFLYGFALANRPPVLFFLPFFIVVWWWGRKKWESSWRQTSRSLGCCVGVFLAPMLISFVVLWVRDRPDVPYNYIEQHNIRAQELPDVSAGWRAKLQRVVWEARGEQFADLMGADWPQVRQKFRWLAHELFSPQQQDILLLVELIVLVGIYHTWRRAPLLTLLLLGLIAGSVVFVSLYRIHGQAADILPLLFSGAIFGGAAMQSVRLPDLAPPVRRGILIGAAVLALFGILRVSALATLLIPTALFGGVIIALFTMMDPKWPARALAVLMVVWFASSFVSRMPQLIPLLFAAALLGGGGLALVLTRSKARWRPVVPIILVVIMSTVTVLRAEQQPQYGKGISAEPFLRELDVKSLPSDAILCANWYHATALWYERAVRTQRIDIEVMCTDSGRWQQRVRLLSPRPAFVVDPADEIDGYTLEPYRNIWRLIPNASSSSATPPPAALPETSP